jgi:non-heme chloroperoxidase
MASTVTEHEAKEVAKANESGRQPVVFVHGLWLLPNSWDRWAGVFKKAGYAPVMPGWPDDPETVAEAKENPDVFAGKSIGQIADHVAEVIGGLKKKPAVIGHSFGGLLAQIIAGRGLSAATVALDSAPFRGILPLPYSQLKSGSPVLRNPTNRSKAVPLTFDQFHYSFANTDNDEEAKQLYNEFSVPGAGVPLFQAASANLNPWTEAKVDVKNPKRGPLLIGYGSEDHVSPPVVNKAIFKKQSKNKGATKLVEFEGANHGLTIDSTWRKTCNASLDFVKKYAKAG